MSKRCALYARASVPEQHLEMQFVRLRKLAARRGFEVVAQYADRGSSKTRRPGLNALLADARRRKFDVVVVESLQTMVSSTRQLLQTAEELRGYAVELVSLKEGVNTRRSKTFFAAFSAIATLETDIKRENIRLGVRRRMLDGFPVGRQPLEIDHDALVRDRLSGMSLTDVAKKYSVSRASVVRFAREEQRFNCMREGER
jgi:DNA invertase Pin-like site-specific DNA recombinase